MLENTILRPEKDRVMGLTTIGNVRRHIAEVRVRGSRDMLADQQTDRHKHRHVPHTTQLP